MNSIDQVPQREAINGKTVSNGVERWYKDGFLHREDGPAIIWPDNDMQWWLNGKLHRDDGPAVISRYAERWYRHGIAHREDGPAVVWDDGEEWYRYGELHREGGPACINNESHTWYWHGDLHREDGPAVIWSDGSFEFALHEEIYDSVSDWLADLDVCDEEKLLLKLIWD